MGRSLGLPPSSPPGPIAEGVLCGTACTVCYGHLPFIHTLQSFCATRSKNVLGGHQGRITLGVALRLIRRGCTCNFIVYSESGIIKDLCLSTITKRS